MIPPQGIEAVRLLSDGMAAIPWGIVFTMDTLLDKIGVARPLMSGV